MKKRLLATPMEFYKKWPIWVLVPVTLAMVEVFFNLGSFLYYAVLGIAAGLYIAVTQQLDWLSSATLPMHLELLSFLGVALVLLGWVKWVEKRPIASLGFFKKRWFGEMVRGFLLGALQFSLSIGLVWLFGGVALAKVDFSAMTMAYVVSLIPFWLLQGGTEELVTRGWLLPVLHKKVNLAWAIGLSSIVFGLIHLGNDSITFLSILNIALAGLNMALYMLLRDNLWSVIGLHGAWNFVQGNVYGVAVSGASAGSSLFQFASKSGVSDWVSGGDFGTEGSLLTSLVLLSFSGYFAYKLIKEQNSKDITPA